MSEVIPYIRWWDDGAKGERWKYAVPYYRKLEEDNSTEHERFLQNAWLYHRRPLMGIDGEWDEPPDPSDSSTNLCEHAVDTAWSVIARSDPDIVCQTSGADFSLQQRAQWLQRWWEAESERMGVDEDAGDASRDSQIFGTGAVYHFENEYGRPDLESVIIDELITDVRECRRGKPRQMARRHFMDIDILLAQDFVDSRAKREAVERAASTSSRGSFPWTWFRRCERGLIPVIHAWRLGYGRGSRRIVGRELIAIDGIDLYDETYDEDELPFSFLHWSPPVTGFYGRGLVDQLAAKQFRVDKRNWVLQRSEDLVARPRLFLRPQDRQLQQQMSNSLEDFIYVASQDYQFQVAKPFGPEVYQARRDDLIEGMEFAGISPSAASGTTPGDVESALALQEVAERENSPFALHIKRYQRFRLEIARKTIALQKKIAKRDGADAVPDAMWNSGNLTKLIPWSKVVTDEDVYELRLAPASGLPRTPAARLNAVIQLGQAGLMDADEMRAQSDHPDLRKSSDLATAARRDIERTIEILEDEDLEFPTPEPFQNLVLGLQMVQFRYLHIKGLNAPEEVLDRFRQWITQAQNVVKQAEAAAQAQAALAAGAGAQPPTPDDAAAAMEPPEAMPMPEAGAAPPIQ